MPYWTLYVLFARVAIHLCKLAATSSAHRYREAHGLQFARPLKQTETILSLALFKRLQQNAKDGVSLQSHYESTKIAGPTVSAKKIKAVLATRFADFNLKERSDAFRPFLGRGIFTEDGAEWERSRALISPAFSKTGAQFAELSIIEEHVLNLLGRIPHGAETVDLQRLFFNFTLDSATHSLLGRPAERFSRAFDDAQAYLQVRARLGAFRMLARNTAFEQDCRVLRAAVDGYVSGALALHQRMKPEAGGEGNEKERYDLLSELASTVSDRVQIRSQLLNVLLAARDTTASLLSSVFFMLARHPSVWEKLEREVLVEAVPIADLCSTPRDESRQPVFVAKGTIVHYSIWTMHRSTEIYGVDAEEFRPERWLQPEEGSGKESLRPGWGFLPFSAGPRFCLGQQRALTEAAYVVVRMVQTFCNVETRDERPWREHIGVGA
ncbi:cytochrome P450 [Aspergillus recurvatus]